MQNEPVIPAVRAFVRETEVCVILPGRPAVPYISTARRQAVYTIVVVNAVQTALVSAVAVRPATVKIPNVQIFAVSNAI